MTCSTDTTLVSFKDLELEVDEFSETKHKGNGGIFSSIYRRKSRSSKKILSNLNFELSSGDRVALIGGNGAGKTTLLKVLAGIRKPSSGEARFSSDNRFLLGNHRLGFLPNATVEENILMNGLSKGIGLAVLKSNIDRILDFAEMINYRNVETSALSAGQNMRIALGVSLIAEADLYLIDEWIGALDKYFFKKFNAALIEKLANSKSLVMASHNNKLLKSMCNLCAVMEEGTIVYFGDLEQGLSKYQ